MRITCIIHSLNGGGAERVMAGLVDRLSQRGHEVTLITFDDGGQDRYRVDEEVERVSLDFMGDSSGTFTAVWANLRRIRLLRSAILRSSADVVLSFCDVTNVLTLLAASMTSIPVVVAERSDPEAQRMSQPWQWLRPRLYRRAAAVTSLTTAAAQTISRWTGRQVVLIPSAVDAPPDRESQRRGPGRRRVIAAGRLEPEKGFDRLISAFSVLTPAHPDWDLHIFGDGRQRESLSRQAEALEVSDRVFFPGWCQPLWDELRQADLFVLPSRYEGFPSVLLEAMAVGCCCVAVDCASGPRSIIRDGSNGLLVRNPWEIEDQEGEFVSPHDDSPRLIATLSETMARCMSDAPLRERLAAEARSITERFGWTAMVDAYELLLASIVNGSAAQPPGSRSDG